MGIFELLLSVHKSCLFNGLTLGWQMSVVWREWERVGKRPSQLLPPFQPLPRPSSYNTWAASLASNASIHNSHNSSILQLRGLGFLFNLHVLSVLPAKCVHVHHKHACKDQKRTSECLTLELQTVWATMWVLGAKLGCSVRAASALNCEPSLQPWLKGFNWAPRGKRASSLWRITQSMVIHPIFIYLH